MKLVKPYYEIWEQPAGLEGVYKQIEKAARICYKSEDKITEDSAKLFVDKLIKLKHWAMLEHGTVYLKVPSEKAYNGFGYNWVFENYFNNPYSTVNSDNNNNFFISTNYRVLIENNWIDDLAYLYEPTKFHEKRITVHFILSRSIAQEFTRHRVFSFAMESQRYCNYSKDKFSNEVTFIIPSWDYNKTANYNGRDEFSGDFFEHSLKEAERYYFKLLDLGWKPQQAREVLPNACKTELVMTGFKSDWAHFFELRDDIKAHPQARELAKPLHEEFIKRRYL